MRIESSSEETGTQYRAVRLTIATVFAIVMVAYGVVRMGLPALTGAYSDLTLDKLAVNAVVDGENPYESVEALAGRYGVTLGDVGASELGDATRTHPRPPGAILLLLPLVSIPYDLVHFFSLVVNILAAVALLYAVALATKVRADWVLLGAPLLILSNPAISAFEFGSQSFVVAALVTLGVGLLRSRDSVFGGVVVGVAITMKLWPALLLIPLWRGARRQSVRVAVGVSAGLNIIAMVLFRLSPIEVLRGFAHASETWIDFEGNGSLLGRLAIVGASEFTALAISALLLLPILWVTLDRRIDLELALWGTVLVAVIASPLSWDHYNIVLIPVVIVLATRSRSWFDVTRWALIGWAVLTWGGRYLRLIIDKPIEIAGVLAFSERALVMVTLLQVVLWQRREVPPIPANQLKQVEAND